MANAKVYNMSGDFIEEIALDDAIFGIEPNESAVHAVVVNQLANKRQGTQSAKTRSEVSGGGKKPYRQKGTGRARQGSTRAAQWIKGGIIFAPKPRSYRYTLNKKLRRLALKSALSSKASAEEILVLDAIAVEEIKTSKIAARLKALNVDTTALIVTAESDEKVVKSARNIAGVSAATVGTINVYDVLRHNKFIITKEALAKVSEVYA
jgi:large subunit ribosomal protein L4